MQEPITRSVQLTHIPVTAFSQTNLFLVWIYAWIQIPTETSVTNCNHKHALMLTCRHVHVRPHCFILTEACSCRLELEYFAEKISKNRLVCKNAVTLAYYESCRLLVMGSWLISVWSVCRLYFVIQMTCISIGYATRGLLVINQGSKLTANWSHMWLDFWLCA